MWKRFLPVGTVTIAVLALSLATAGVAEAGSKDMKFGYHFGDAFLGCAGVLPTDPPIGVIPGDPTCRPEAVAEDFEGAFPGEGGSIAIQGEGEFTVSEKGKLKKAKGGGLFAQFDESGVLLSSGTWKARKLLLFEAYGDRDTEVGHPDHVFRLDVAVMIDVVTIEVSTGRTDYRFENIYGRPHGTVPDCVDLHLEAVLVELGQIGA